MRTVARLALAGLLAAAASPLPAPARAQDAPAPPAAPAGPAAAPAEEIPPAPERAPLPPPPPAKIAKALEASIRKWFDNDPDFAKEPLTAKKLRTEADSEIEEGVKAWNAALGGKNNGLRLVEWWKARCLDTLTQENQKTGLFQVDFKGFKLALSIPPGYKAKSSALYPVILTVLEKDTDYKKAFEEAYGPLRSTHLIVATYDDPAKASAPRERLVPLLYLFWTYRADRDRVVLDGLGKSARLVDALAADSAIYFNGAIFRGPTSVSPVAPNLALFPCLAVVPAAPTKASQEALEGLRRNCRDLREAPAAEASKAVQEWVAALPPRRIVDQRQDYAWCHRSVRPRWNWGYWFEVVRTVDAGSEPELNVSIRIRREPGRNLVDLECRNLAEGLLYLNDEVLDLDHPVYVRVNGIVVHREEVPVRRSSEAFHYDHGTLAMLLAPRHFFVTCTIRFSVPPEARLTKEEREAMNGGGKTPPDPGGGAAPEAGKETPPAEAPPAGEPSGAPVAGAKVDWYESLAKAEEAAGKDGRAVFALFEAPPGENPDPAALEGLISSDAVRERLSKFACARVATGTETPAVVAVVEETARVEAKDAPLLLALQADGTVAARVAVLAAGTKPEDATVPLAKWLDERLAAAGVALPEEKPGEPPPAGPPAFPTIEEARGAGRPVLVRCLAVGEGLAPPPAEIAAVLEAPAVARRLAAFAIVGREVKAEGPLVLTRTTTVTVHRKDAPVLLALARDGRIAERLDGAALKPEEAEAALKDWFARALAATGAKAPEGAPPAETPWTASLDEARKASDLPVLVLCTAAPATPAGEALEKALAGDGARAALAAFSRARVPAAMAEVVTTLKGPPEVQVGAKDAPVLYALRADGSVIGSVGVSVLKPGESPEGFVRWLGDMLAKAAEKPGEPKGPPPPPPADAPK